MMKKVYDRLSISVVCRASSSTNQVDIGAGDGWKLIKRCQPVVANRLGGKRGWAGVEPG